MSKIATISCIILAVSINLEGTQASLLGNRLNPLNGLLDKLPTLDKLEDTIADIGKDVSDLGTNIGADFTNELNNGVIKQASIMSCLKLPNQANQTINELGSIVKSCVSQELQVVDNYVQSINKLVTDLTTTIQNEIQQFIQDAKKNILDAIKNLMNQLPDLINQINPKIEKIGSTIGELFSSVSKDLGSCFQNSYTQNVQQGVNNLLNNAKDCLKSLVPFSG